MNCNSTQSHGHDLAAFARRCVAFLVLVIFASALSNTPRRSEVMIKTNGNFKIVEYSWIIAGNNDGMDTLLLGPFNIGGLCYLDSIIRVMMYSEERTMDSISWVAEYQFSLDLFPNNNVNSSSWFTVEREVNEFCPHPPGIYVPYLKSFGGYDEFRPRRYGAYRHFRIRVVAIDQVGTGVLKFRVIIPLSESAHE